MIKQTFTGVTPASVEQDRPVKRRDFLKASAAVAAGGLLLSSQVLQAAGPDKTKPNILYIFADQWRGQATGYAGDPNLKGKTPNIDKLAAASVNMFNTVSTTPVCTPYRASLLTGQYPLTHGLFLNDTPLDPEATTIAKLYKKAGYATAYVGKWHVDGHGRSAFIPKERRQGFDYWKVLECTHNYNHSAYYDGDHPDRQYWEGYDAIAQTRDVRQYIKAHAGKDHPFLMMLSWGSPHNPYGTAPAKYKKMFKPEDLKLRDNVQDSLRARKDLAGYYAHCAALDDCVGALMRTLAETGIKENTIVVFTADHGDMLWSHGQIRKQKPWDESVLVPFLIRYPAKLGAKGGRLDMPMGTPDILPTLLGLSGIKVPGSVEGKDFSAVLSGDAKPANAGALIECQSPFGEWRGGREYRGLRTRRYTYVRDLKGPWLLYDNHADPYQLKNLVADEGSSQVLKRLDALLTARLKVRGDTFRPGKEYREKWGYKTVNDTIPTGRSGKGKRKTK